MLLVAKVNMSIKILVLSGSNRTDSLNQKLAETLKNILSDKEFDAKCLRLSDYKLPLFNADLPLPVEAETLANEIWQCDGLVIASPEYNGSLAPLLKNALDWASRVKIDDEKPYAFYEKSCYLTACSPGALGGFRGLKHLRDVLTSVGGLVLNNQLAVGNGFEAFDDAGNLVDERIKKMAVAGLDDLVVSIKRVQAVTR